MLDRREFIAGGAMAALAAAFPAWAEEIVRGAKHPLAGAKLPSWKPGSMRITIHYTGRSESAFIILPDSTSLLIDCGEYEFKGGGSIMPHCPAGATAGEAICRSVLRENPNGKKVDYFVLSHYHSDHAGSIRKWNGAKYPRSANGKYTLCGMGRAIDMLDFGTMIDRSWPDMADPVKRSDSFDSGVVPHVREVYEEAVRRGIKVERFRLEKESDQIRPLHGGFKGFGFTPLCARGLVLRRDGSIFDLGKLKGMGSRSKFPENPLSTGMILSVGDFRYYTAGDYETEACEDVLAAECPVVDVAKSNHHATNTMYGKLLQALSPRVLLTGGCWHKAHTGTEAMGRVEKHLKGKCFVAPGFFPECRRKKDAGAAWLRRLPRECFTPCHVVVDVAPGGGEYTVAMVDARTENGPVLGAYDFKTAPKNAAV